MLPMDLRAVQPETQNAGPYHLRRLAPLGGNRVGVARAIRAAAGVGGTGDASRALCLARIVVRACTRVAIRAAGDDAGPVPRRACHREGVADHGNVHSCATTLAR